MKKIFLLFLLTISCYAQHVNLGPTNIQVQGILGQTYGGTGITTPWPTNCNISGESALYWDPSSNKLLCNNFDFSSLGTVTNVSATISSNSPLFSVSVSNPSTTPNISFSVDNLNNQVYVGTGTNIGEWLNLPNCSGGITYNYSGYIFGCANSVFFSNGGGAVPGTSYNGSSGITVDYSTVGAPSVTGAGASGTWGINVTGYAATLENTPNQCSSGLYSTGIASNGNANCFQVQYSQISGTPTPVTLYYQTVESNGSSLPQQPTLNFNSTLSAANGTGVTLIGLPSVISGGTTINPSSITVDNYGRVTSLNGSGSSVTLTNCQTTICAGGSTYSTGTLYTNNQSYPITEYITMNTSGGAGQTGSDNYMSVYLQGQIVCQNGTWNITNGYAGCPGIKVAPGWQFMVVLTHVDGGGTPSISAWYETNF